MAVNLIPRNGIAGINEEIDSKQVVILARQIMNNSKKVEQWELALTKEGYDKNLDDILSELAQGLKPEEDKLTLFCETFNFDYPLANIELDELNEIRETMAREKAEERDKKKQEKENSEKNKQRNQELKNIDLFKYLPEDEISTKDIAERLMKSDTLKTKFERTDNHDILIDDVDFTIDFVTKVKPNEFDGHMTIGEIGEKWGRKLIGYNSAIQRGTKITKTQEKAIFEQAKVDAIVEEIEKDNYVSSTIYICLWNDGTAEEPVYDDEERTLTFSGKKFIIEGQHRCHAFCKLWVDKITDKVPELDLNQLVSVRFLYYTTEEAKKAFVQLSKVKPIPKSRQMALEENKYSEIVRILNRESEIKGQINMVSANASGKYLTSISVLREALEMTNLSLPSNRAVQREAEYLKKFIEVLVDEFPAEFSEEDIKHRNELKKTQMLNQSIMWYALIALAYHDKVNYETNIMKLHDVDFTRLNPIWEDLQKKASGEEYDLKIVNDSSTKVRVIEILFKQLGFSKPKIKNIKNKNDDKKNSESTPA